MDVQLVVAILLAVAFATTNGIHDASNAIATLVALAVSPPLGAVGALIVIRSLRRAGRRATRRWVDPVRRSQWVTSAALAFSHGANDAQKSVGIIAALLLADGRIQTLSAPT